MKRNKNELPTHENKGALKVRAALEDLGDCWMYGPEFREAYGITESTLARNRRNFPGNFLRYGRHSIWSGDPTTLKAMKEKLDE